MSERRKAGDVVRLMEQSGFGGTPGRYRIDELGEPESCWICKNPECNEWPNLERLDETGVRMGEYACHVSECRMVDRYPLLSNEVFDAECLNNDGSYLYESGALISLWPLKNVNNERLDIIEINGELVFAIIPFKKDLPVKEISPRYVSRKDLERFILLRWYGYEAIINDYLDEGRLNVNIQSFFMWAPPYDGGCHCNYPKECSTL